MSNEDKPLGETVGWKRLGTTYPFATKWLRLREDRIDKDGHDLVFAYVDGPGAVIVVPLTPEGEIVLIRQYRYTVDEILVELPAGGLHDTENKTPEEVAVKELREEIGASCEKIDQVGWFYSTVGGGRNIFYVFLAQGVRLDSEQELEFTEQIEILPLPAADAFEMARSGQIKDGDSALALLLCEKRLKEEGYL